MGGVVRSACTVLAVICALVLGGFGSSDDALGFNEAPMLAKLVKSKDLPVVDKRLPEQPVVIKPYEKPGVYGGTWRRAYLGMTDLNEVRKICYEPLVRWSPSYAIVPNLARSWDISNDGRVFTFQLVKGVKWSDGEPFTADDILFYVQDVASNKEIFAAPPRWLAPQGTLPKVSKTDDFTVRFEFDEPYGLFLQQLACPHAVALVSCPKHYLKKFHKKYAGGPELEALLKERKASSWGSSSLTCPTFHRLCTDLPICRAFARGSPRFPRRTSVLSWNAIPITGKSIQRASNSPISIAS